MPAGVELDGQDGERAQVSPTSLEVRFAQSQLSRSRRQLIRAILDSHEEAFFLSSREMARRYNVDAATLVRTIQALGYERFADFAADLRHHFVKQITPYAVLKAATRENRSVADHMDAAQVAEVVHVEAGIRSGDMTMPERSARMLWSKRPG